MHVYMDDVRDGPMSGAYGTQIPDQTWVVVRRIDYMKELLAAGLVHDASLDHNMGPGETGYDLVKWMEATGNWPKGKVTVHSANPVGRQAMEWVLARNGK
jgi:hypothetical protein